MAGLEGLRVGNATAVSREALIARLEGRRLAICPQTVPQTPVVICQVHNYRTISSYMSTGSGVLSEQALNDLKSPSRPSLPVEYS